MFYNDLFDALDAAFDAERETVTASNKGYSLPSFPPCKMTQAKDGTVKLILALAGYEKENISITTEENRVVVSTVEGYERPKLEDGVKVIAGNIY